MSGGDLPKYIEDHSGTDLLALVSIPPSIVHPTLTPITSYLASLKVSNIFTHAM